MTPTLEILVEIELIRFTVSNSALLCSGSNAIRSSVHVDGENDFGLTRTRQISSIKSNGISEMLLKQKAKPFRCV